MFWYLRNQRSKQTNLADSQFLLNYALFSKNWCRKLLKKNLKYKRILYNSTELSVDWTSREFQNQSIVFSRKNKDTLSDLRQFLVTKIPLLMIKMLFISPWNWNLWRLSLVKKQLQYTYWLISQEVKTTRQWNLVS